jgi:hypothetical protein
MWVARPNFSDKGHLTDRAEAMRIAYAPDEPRAVNSPF